MSDGGAESLTHFLKSFLAELDLCLAVCGVNDIATLQEAGCEPAMRHRAKSN
jgi:isopentenyl diphosphate isomerase/L-lactate dehydrogenase-like FMN-dependent dehydrogenase